MHLWSPRHKPSERACSSALAGCSIPIRASRLAFHLESNSARRWHLECSLFSLYGAVYLSRSLFGPSMSATNQIQLNDLSTANTSTRTSVDLDDDTQARLNKIGEQRSEAFESYPDGGRQAWLQVFCCFALFFTTLGGTYSWGVLQDALYESGAAPTATLSWIGSTLATHQAIFAVPIIRVVGAYGPKRIAIIGSLLAGIGPIIAGSCSRSVPGLVVTEVRTTRLGLVPIHTAALSGSVSESRAAKI